ncbi:MAG: hypothetical protein RET84_02655 [Pseudomonadota bacterium]|nr:hypothetical protein [Pseudomonadota bacterium]
MASSRYRWEDDAGIADLIGKHWVRDITSGEGQYENCNRRKKRYGRRLAIGLVEHFDVVKRERLAEVVVTYGCKGNYFARALAGKGAKLMIKGEWPEVDPGKGGRPRTRVGRTRETLAMQLERMGIQPSRKLVEWHEIPQSEVPY